MPPHTPDTSTPPEYFDRMYAESDDPWRFETSEYERRKYAATLAALPRARYENALEIGCSIGVLTGGFSEQELSEAGASDVFESVAELRKHVNEVIVRV